MLNGRINWTDPLGKLHFILGKQGKREITQSLLRIIRKNQTTWKQSLHRQVTQLFQKYFMPCLNHKHQQYSDRSFGCKTSLQFFVLCFIHLNFFPIDIYLWTFWIYSACFCNHFNTPVIFHPQITNTCSQHDCRISRAFFSPWYLPCSH